jgi:hypothetical protein
MPLIIQAGYYVGAKDIPRRQVYFVIFTLVLVEAVFSPMHLMVQMQPLAKF